MKPFKKRDYPLSEIRRHLEPGPIVLVSSAWKGKTNIMTMGWHMMMQFTPALFASYIWDGNHSFEIIRRSKECVINVPTTDLVNEVVEIGNCSGAEIDKFKTFGLTPVPGTKVSVPLIKECYANFECKLADGRLISKYLPDTLIESELFGFEKGAFTGALGRKKGLFEVAENGTLFLDEIGELKLELQAKLLKAIDQQKIRRLGGTKDIHCNVRILAASSRNLQRMVRIGTFREDLYYRVAVFELDIPPLRERQDDIRELICRQLATEQVNAGVPEPLRIDERAIRELSSYYWPGNIRQLHNVLARLACYSDSQTISADHVRGELSRLKNFEADTISLPDSCSTLLPGEGLEDFSHRVRGSLIEAVKNRMNGNISRAAQRLKVNRSSLHDIIRKISTRATSKAGGGGNALAA